MRKEATTYQPYSEYVDKTFSMVARETNDLIAKIKANSLKPDDKKKLAIRTINQIIEEL